MKPARCQSTGAGAGERTEQATIATATGRVPTSRGPARHAKHARTYMVNWEPAWEIFALDTSAWRGGRKCDFLPRPPGSLPRGKPHQGPTVGDPLLVSPRGPVVFFSGCWVGPLSLALHIYLSLFVLQPPSTGTRAPTRRRVDEHGNETGEKHGTDIQPRNLIADLLLTNRCGTHSIDTAQKHETTGGNGNT